MDLNDIPDGPIMPEGAAPEAPADEPLDAVARSAGRRRTGSL